MRYNNSKEKASAYYKDGKLIIKQKGNEYKAMNNGNLKPVKK